MTSRDTIYELLDTTHALHLVISQASVIRRLQEHGLNHSPPIVHGTCQAVGESPSPVTYYSKQFWWAVDVQRTGRETEEITGQSKVLDIESWFLGTGSGVGYIYIRAQDNARLGAYPVSRLLQQVLAGDAASVSHG